VNRCREPLAPRYCPAAFHAFLATAGLVGWCFCIYEPVWSSPAFWAAFALNYFAYQFNGWCVADDLASFDPYD
jgi:hypothetical protein